MASSDARDDAADRPCILLVCNAREKESLTLALTLGQGGTHSDETAHAPRVEWADGGDDTVALFSLVRPQTVVIAAALDAGDARVLLRVLREDRRAFRSVLIGEGAGGQVRSALDATEFGVDRFVAWPVEPAALRNAVAVTLPAASPAALGVPSTDGGERASEPEMVRPTSTVIQPRRARTVPLVDEPVPASPVAPPSRWQPGSTEAEGGSESGEGSPADATHRSAKAGDAKAGAGDANAGEANANALGLTERGVDEGWTRAPSVRAVDDGADARTDAGRAAANAGHLDLGPGPSLGPGDPVPFGGEFARELRKKMSEMAVRLFRHDPSRAGSAAVALRYDHRAEIDLEALVDSAPVLASMAEPAAGPRAAPADASRGDSQTQITRDDATATQNTHPRADAGDLVRGQSDVAFLMARALTTDFTGALEVRRGDVEKIIYFEHGRPGFATSNQTHDRMGQLLFREGKISAAQYERCQLQVAASGRRMGEILVDLGYLKRRELLPAVRRHLEDLVYSVFSWPDGQFQFVRGDGNSHERIRLAKQPAAMVIEGIRRKLTEAELVSIVGGSKAVIEVATHARVAPLVAAAELSPEELRAFAAIDGRRSLEEVASASGVEPYVVLQLAYGLAALGLSTMRRPSDGPDDAAGLVGETDLAIDRERVRTRWALVMEADYFALLGVRRDATTFEIRRAYEAARRDFAPDSFPPVLRRELAFELGEIEQVLDEAHRALRDPDLRSRYLGHLVDEPAP